MNVPAMNVPLDKFTYLFLMVACLFFPLVFSFDKRVAFYRKWPILFVATILPAAFFILWDVWFNNTGVWSFNNNFLLGYRLFGLPIEEWSFFFVIPYCSLFCYEVMQAYFPKLNFNRQIYWLLIALFVTFLVIVTIYHKQRYTFWNFTFNAFFLGFLLLNSWFRTHITHFIFTFVACILPMLVVNGVLTSMPVVEYNLLHISGIKVYNIPFEDFFYFFLLFMMNIIIYERLQPQTKV